jgi:hypothetical protein
MLISLKFPEGAAFQPIMSNLEEEIIEETTPIRGNLWETRKASISCHFLHFAQTEDIWLKS